MSAGSDEFLRLSKRIHDNIRMVCIPNNVREVADLCFRRCKSLRFVTFSKFPQVERIGIDAFLETRIKEVCIPDSVR